jgi:hypothetical protein
MPAEPANTAVAKLAAIRFLCTSALRFTLDSEADEPNVAEGSVSGARVGQ